MLVQLWLKLIVFPTIVPRDAELQVPVTTVTWPAPTPLCGAVQPDGTTRVPVPAPPPEFVAVNVNAKSFVLAAETLEGLTTTVKLFAAAT